MNEKKNAMGAILDFVCDHYDKILLGSLLISTIMLEYIACKTIDKTIDKTNRIDSDLDHHIDKLNEVIDSHNSLVDRMHEIDGELDTIKDILGDRIKGGNE